MILIYGEILLFLQNECEFPEGKDSFCLFLLCVRSSAHRVSGTYEVLSRCICGTWNDRI